MKNTTEYDVMLEGLTIDFAIRFYFCGEVYEKQDGDLDCDNVEYYFDITSLNKDGEELNSLSDLDLDDATFLDLSDNLKSFIQKNYYVFFDKYIEGCEIVPYEQWYAEVEADRLYDQWRDDELTND